MKLTFQADDDDYVSIDSVVSVINWMKASIQACGPHYGHLWYGEVSSELPLLSIGCFPGAGVFLSLRVHDCTLIYVDSNNYNESHSIQWGQDDVVIPQAYLMSPMIAEEIVEFFSTNGTILEDAHWREDQSLHWDLYADADEP